jgi:NAD(P)-dependent dehydrogenase (short-subunit alcohol dehydrogenase family)
VKSLAGKTILITGAGGGFGREMIRQFLLAGSYLILSDISARVMARAAEETVAQFGEQRPPGRVLGYVAADLSSAAGADELYRGCGQMVPTIDILINNAGLGLYGPIHAVPREKWERLMQVNLLAPMRLTALFLPAMIERRSGHIVNVASAAGLVGAPGLTAYSAAKFGLRGFGEALAADANRHGVDVTTIYPFFARTPILQSEQFGLEQPPELPERFLYEPSFIVAALIDGIRRRRAHVYPGAIPRQIDLLRRVAPWALRRLNRR